LIIGVIEAETIATDILTIRGWCDHQHTRPTHWNWD